jgi:hypothetical protein
MAPLDTCGTISRVRAAITKKRDRGFDTDVPFHGIRVTESVHIGKRGFRLERTFRVRKGEALTIASRRAEDKSSGSIDNSNSAEKSILWLRKLSGNQFKLE